MIASRSVKTAASWLCLLSMMGCGSSTQSLQLIPIMGTVTLDGKPVGGVSMFFNPLPNTHGAGGYAITNEAGSFEVMHLSNKRGIEKGRYGVTFSKITQKDGSPIPAGKTRAGVDTVEKIPKVYTTCNPTQTAEVADITESTSSLDFALRSDRKGPSGGRAGVPK